MTGSEERASVMVAGGSTAPEVHSLSAITQHDVMRDVPRRPISRGSVREGAFDHHSWNARPANNKNTRKPQITYCARSWTSGTAYTYSRRPVSHVHDAEQVVCLGGGVCDNTHAAATQRPTLSF